MELARLTWPDARDALSRAGVALLPVGSTEQHGPHLPLGTDHLTAEWIAREAARRGGFLLLPTVPVGVSVHHRQFWGTLWVEPEVLQAYVTGIARSLAIHGLKKLVFVNGHGGNTAALTEAAHRLRREGMPAYVFVWWRAVGDEVRALLEDGGGHAGEMEASVVWHIDPELVRPERFAGAAAEAAPAWGKAIRGVEVGYDTIDFAPAGCVGSPERASPEKGEKILEAAVEKLIAFCRWLADAPLEELLPKPHKP
ncbi:creatininase family protein [Candidatus Bipolaricaulota sp. J31]